MAIKIANAAEIQKNFEKYMNLLMNGHEIIVTKNGHEIGRFIPKNAAASYLTDSLTGILTEICELDRAKTERLTEKLKLHYL